MSALDDILSGLGSLTCSQVKGSLVPDKPPKTYPPSHPWQIESKTNVSWRRTSRVKSSNANWVMEKISRTCRYRTLFFFFQKSGIICHPTRENSPWLHLGTKTFTEPVHDSYMYRIFISALYRPTYRLDKFWGYSVGHTLIPHHWALPSALRLIHGLRLAYNLHLTSLGNKKASTFLLLDRQGHIFAE